MNIRMSIKRTIWRGQWHARRALRAARYILGRTTEDDASQMLWETENLAGRWPLSCISTESVMERALDTYAAHPALRDICDDAAARVGSKWSDDGEMASAAIDWAMELVQRYASDRSVDLIEITEDERETEDA